MTDTPLNTGALAHARSATFDCWENGGNMDDLAECTIEAYLAVARPVVNSVEELDALPVGSVILDGDPCVLQMVEKSSIVGSEWAIANEEHIYTTGKITLPARVLYRPEVKP